MTGGNQYSLTPNETDTHEDAKDEDHVANVDMMSTMIFGMFGISDKLNLNISAPYIWQRLSPAEHEDEPQHKNEIGRCKPEIPDHLFQ